MIRLQPTSMFDEGAMTHGIGPSNWKSRVLNQGRGMMPGLMGQFGLGMLGQNMGGSGLFSGLKGGGGGGGGGGGIVGLLARAMRDRLSGGMPGRMGGGMPGRMGGGMPGRMGGGMPGRMGGGMPGYMGGGMPGYMGGGGINGLIGKSFRGSLGGQGVSPEMMGQPMGGTPEMMAARAEMEANPPAFHEGAQTWNDHGNALLQRLLDETGGQPGGYTVGEDGTRTPVTGTAAGHLSPEQQASVAERVSRMGGMGRQPVRGQYASKPMGGMYGTGHGR